MPWIVALATLFFLPMDLFSLSALIVFSDCGQIWPANRRLESRNVTRGLTASNKWQRVFGSRVSRCERGSEGLELPSSFHFQSFLLAWTSSAVGGVDDAWTTRLAPRVRKGSHRRHHCHLKNHQMTRQALCLKKRYPPSSPAFPRLPCSSWPRMGLGEWGGQHAWMLR